MTTQAPPDRKPLRDPILGDGLSVGESTVEIIMRFAQELAKRGNPAAGRPADKPFFDWLNDE